MFRILTKIFGVEQSRFLNNKDPLNYQQFPSTNIKNIFARKGLFSPWGSIVTAIF